MIKLTVKIIWIWLINLDLIRSVSDRHISFILLNIHYIIVVESYLNLSKLVGLGFRSSNFESSRVSDRSGSSWIRFWVICFGSAQILGLRSRIVLNSKWSGFGSDRVLDTLILVVMSFRTNRIRINLTLKKNLVWSDLNLNKFFESDYILLPLFTGL
jgi:hypothetical protein